MKRLLIAVFIGMFLMCFAPVQADTQGIRLVWQSEVPADLAGFRVYMNADSAVSPCPDPAKKIVDLSYNPADTSFSTDFQLIGDNDQVFHFTVTAYDTSGNESACSVEATYQMPPDTTPPGVPFDLTIEVVVIPPTP